VDNCRHQGSQSNDTSSIVMIQSGEEIDDHLTSLESPQETEADVLTS
jgi:hypothetical protein